MPRLSISLRMTFAIGVEFVKMLCTHTPGTVIEVLLFAISRQMIVGHVSGFEVLAGVAAIAGLFATHKYLYAKSFGTEEKEEKQDKKQVEGQFDMYNYKLAEIAHEVDKINLNELTPIDALNTLVRIKEKMK